MSPLLRTAPGQTLEGRFLLLEEVARGPMSTVYKAKDLGEKIKEEAKDLKEKAGDKIKDLKDKASDALNKDKDATPPKS